MPRVEIARLGAAASIAGRLAEFDCEDGVIRISAEAVGRVRAALGPYEARKFIACAVAHERHHWAHQDDGEDAAHAAARESTGTDPRRYEALLRAARR